MVDFSKFKASIDKEKAQLIEDKASSNPLKTSIEDFNPALSNYKQSITRTEYDSELVEILEVVRILNNMAPVRMPVYNLNLNEINGEPYYLPDNTLLLIREFDGDIVRDYYASANNKNFADRILEHDRKSGKLKVKIEPITRKGSRLKTNITIFDDKINNKYILMQLAEDGTVSNITEFSGVGKSFKTLFRDTLTTKPARYLEGKDSKETYFEMIDCIFDKTGNIARIRRYNNKKEIKIDYTDSTKNITVKTKLQ